MDLLLPGLVVGDHLVDGAPVGEATEVAVIDEDISLELAREVLIVTRIFLGIVTVDRPELHAALTTPLHCLLQQLPLTHTPESQLVAIANEHLQRLDGKRFLLANSRVTMLYDRTVKINCYYHFLIELSSLWP